jgi:hypothetical protein
MDFGRFCYECPCDFIFQAARDYHTSIRWYRAPPGAKPFPAQHSFGTRFWGEGPGFVGEKLGSKRVWRSGDTLRGVTGQSFCGEIPDFQIGGETVDVPFNADGVKSCCIPPVISCLPRPSPPWPVARCFMTGQDLNTEGGRTGVDTWQFKFFNPRGSQVDFGLVLDQNCMIALITPGGSFGQYEGSPVSVSPDFKQYVYVDIDGVIVPRGTTITFTVSY